MHTEIMSKLLKLIPSNTIMELPPKIFIEMEGEFVDFVEGESLTVKFQNKEKYMNPFGFMQGGIIVAAIDNTISPLSYVVAPPNVTKEICTSFKRPVKKDHKFIFVKASVVKKTSLDIILQAEVTNEIGKIVAIGTANCMFIKEKKSR